MDFKHLIGRIEDSDVFKEFIKSNNHYYLVHVFRVKDERPTSQIGYYSADTDKIVVFEEGEDGSIFLHAAEDALKEENYIKKLEIDNIKISMNDASEMADTTVKAHYPTELPSKHIFLLQNLPEYDHIWNITIVTLAFSVINIKIDADTGKVIKHTRENLLNWKSASTQD